MSSPSTAFTEDQYAAIYPDGVQYHYWTRARNALVTAFIRKAEITGKILEIGAGRGVCVEHFRKAGLQVDGVEIAPVPPLPSVTSYVKSGIDATQLPPEARAQYTALAFLDVIEHIEDPVSFLRSMLEAFPNAKSVIVTVPARKELFSNYDEFNGHFRRYDRKDLSAHLEGAGLKVSRMRYLFHSLYLAGWLQLKLQGARSTEFKVPGKCARPLHAVISAFLQAESTMMPPLVAGTSVIALAKRCTLIQ